MLKKLLIVFSLLVLPAQAWAVNWQTPNGYTRSPSGTTPTNPITFSASFNDQTGCPYAEYRFWVFSSTQPLYSLGSNTSLVNGSVTQTVTLPDGVGVASIRLACVDGSGNRYDSGGNLESGSPAFTPTGLVNWQTPTNYSRTPTGTTPANPITVSVTAGDETNCSFHTYSFWTVDLDGVLLDQFNTNVAISNNTITQTSSMSAGQGVAGIVLVCMNGATPVAQSAPLEKVAAAFTPHN